MFKILFCTLLGQALSPGGTASDVDKPASIKKKEIDRKLTTFCCSKSCDTEEIQ